MIAKICRVKEPDWSDPRGWPSGTLGTLPNNHLFMVTESGIAVFSGPDRGFHLEFNRYPIDKAKRVPAGTEFILTQE